MMAHDPQKRYRYLDEAIEEIFWARLQIGDLADGAASTSETEEALLRKLLGSTNRLHQEEAAKPALRLGKNALPILHEALGSRRLDVASTAYAILGRWLMSPQFHTLCRGYIRVAPHPNRGSRRAKQRHSP